MALPRPSWRSALRYAAEVAEHSNSNAFDATPQASQQRYPNADGDYYEPDGSVEEQNAFIQMLGQQLVPAHMVFAAFGAGWAARGHASVARRIISAIADAALQPARAVRGRRRRSSNEEAQDFATLIAELDADGAAARQAAAKRLGITEAYLHQRAKGKPSQQKSGKQFR